MTKKQLLMKVLPMLSSLIILVVIAFSCSTFAGKNNVPAITDPNGEFVTLGDLEITNQEVYNKIIDQFGAKELRQYVDRDLLQNGEVDYIELAKNDPEFDIDEILERTMYNGFSYSEAVKIYSEETIEDFEYDFEQRIIYNGYADLDAYIEDLYLEQARGLYAKAMMLENQDITLHAIANEYNNNYYNEVTALLIRVDSLEEMTSLLEDQGILIDEQGLFIEEYTNEEVLEAYVNIYNVVYGARTNLTYLDGSIVETDLEDLQYNFEDTIASDSSLANLLFITLDTEETFDAVTLTQNKTYSSPVALSSSPGIYIAYKFSGDNANDFSSLFPELTTEQYNGLLATPYSEVEKTDLIDELFLDVVNSRAELYQFVSEYLNDLTTTQELTIYDPYLKSNFDEIYGETLENEGSKEVVFSYVQYDGTLFEMTADMFFDLIDNHAAPVAVNLLNAEMAVKDEDVYDEHVTDELVAELTNRVNEYKVGFQQNQYAEYGFDSSEMNWNEFLYAAFSYRSEQELFDMLLTSTLVEEFKIDLVTSEEIQSIYFDLMVEAYEEAFELDVKHFLVFIDEDSDGAPDLVNEHNWTPEQMTLANDLLNELRILVTAIEDTQQVSIEKLQEIADIYANASFISDESDENYSQWARYKQLGLKLIVEDLSTVTPGMMVETFETELFDMFNSMVDDGLFTLISQNNVETDFGYHLIYSDAYYAKGDAYPEDEKVYPSRVDIEEFNNEEFDNISTETLVFIGKYYTPVTNEYTTKNELVLFDNARASLGTVEFTNPEFLEFYNRVVEMNKTTALR